MEVEIKVWVDFEFENEEELIKELFPDGYNGEITDIKINEN